jgi:hypothetical protein
MLLAQKRDAPRAIPATELLDDGATILARLLCEIQPTLRAIIGDDKRVDRARQRAFAANLGLLSIGQASERHLISGHERFRAGQAGQRNRLLHSALAEVMAFDAKAVDKAIDVSELDACQDPHPIRW